MDRLLVPLAATLRYPTPETAAHASAALAALPAAGLPAAAAEPLAAALEQLSAWLTEIRLEEAQERYTPLFDLSPVCTLHVGYHLFGESYERGALLSGLRAELRKHDVSAGQDLPDFLPVLLELLGRLSAEDRALLVGDALAPALVKMNAALAASTDPWSALLRATPELVAALAPSAMEEAPAHA